MLRGVSVRRVQVASPRLESAGRSVRGEGASAARRGGRPGGGRRGGGKPGRAWTARKKTSDEYGILIRNLYAGSHFSSREIHAIAIASVVPPLTPTIVDLCVRYFGIAPLVVGPGVQPCVSI